ncbi:MAG TPA: hypothetical protein VMD02_06140 [Candidatus Omnitrophota bacterium]|nr:hypothetical protein [Candidatus Omnitrophota bacterium]
MMTRLHDLKTSRPFLVMRSCGLAVLLGIILSGISWGGALDISRLGMGARAIAMGKAQAAAQDPASIFINPANARAIDQFSATSMYSNLAEDLNFSEIGLAFPIREGNLGTMGISYIGSTLSGIQATSLDANGRTYPTNSFDYASQMMTFCYGKSLGQSVAAGGSLKLFSKNFEGIQGGSGTGADVDLGLNYYPLDNLSFGAVLQNVLPQGVSSIGWGTGLAEDIPFNIKLGANYAPAAEWLLLADYDSVGIVHAGAEYWFRKNLALRAGLEDLSNSVNLSAGAGISYAGFSFDYAYCMDVAVWSNSAHYFSLGYQLPPRTVELRPFMPAQKKPSLDLSMKL